MLLLLFGSFVFKTGFAQQFEKWNVRWKHLGPFEYPIQTVNPGQMTAMGMGWIESVAVYEKDERFIYAGSNTGGIYCTQNGGKTWVNVSPKGRVSGVRDIVIDNDDPDKLWIATGTGFPVVEQAFGSGVLYSENGGRSWKETGLSFGREGNSMQIWQLKRSNSDPNVFFAASDTRIFRSVDQCKTFEQVHIGSDGSFYRHLLIHPGNPDHIVCSGSETLVSKDGGDSWTNVTSTLSFNYGDNNSTHPERIALALHPGYTFGLFALYRSGDRNYIDESSDWGGSWINVNRNRDLMRVDRNHAEIAALSKDEVITGSVRVFKINVATDDIQLLTRPVYGAPNFAHDDIRAIAVTKNGNIYIGTDGGVSMSKDNGTTWHDLSGKGLSVTQVYGLDVHPEDPGFVVIGCQDLGNMYYHNKKWYHISRIYGDGGNVHFDRDGSLLIMQNGRIWHTKDTGKTRQSLVQPFYAGRFTYPVAQIYTDTGKIIVAADKYIWKMDTHGQWKKITGETQVANAKKSAMDINISDPGSIFFANWEPTWGTGELLANRLYRSVNKGDTFYWEDLTSKLGILAWASISSIVSHPGDPNRIWFSLYRYDGKEDTKPYKVYYSEDRGETWINYSEGFPNYGIYCMLYIPGSDGGILAGTDGGVFYRAMGMKNWVHLSGAMPEIMVKQMAIDAKTRILFAGTHGNGVWQVKLPKSFF